MKKCLFVLLILLLSLSVTTKKAEEVAICFVEEEYEEEYEEELKPVFEYSEEDLDLLSRLVYSEGGVEDFETKKKIASVVMNRVMNEQFPDTMREVIYQKRQFSVTKLINKKTGKPMIECEPCEDSIKAAEEVLKYGSVLPKDVLVFYASYSKEKWVNSREVFEVSGSTVFAYMYKKGERKDV